MLPNALMADGKRQTHPYLLLLVFLFGTVACGTPETASEESASPPDSAAVRAAIDAAADAPHPRLLFEEQDRSAVQRAVDAPLLEPIYEQVTERADEALETEPVERELEGRRLLGVSRTALRRITHLAFTYRLTGEQQYAERAEAEMLAAADFADWNPDHFLDVAEMTAALAIGYDWLYDELDADARQTIRAAIVEKGLKPSFARDWGWIGGTTNWTQVCHGGLVLGALAVMDHASDLATRIVQRAAEKVRNPMEHYGANGGYVEGPTYWSYGTHYNVVLIDALESALDTDFGLISVEPFMRSPTFYLHAHGPTFRFFNFSDSGVNPDVAPAMYWFANRLDRPALLWMERRMLKQVATGTRTPSDRLLPFLLVWADAEQVQSAPAPSRTHFHDTDPVAVGMHRSGWDEQATFVGIEGGAATGAHAHLDAGSFVVDAAGVRWASDLTRPNYHTLEEADIDLWNFAQDSDRWSIYRLSNFSHSTLVVNDELQRVDGFASVVTHDGDGPRPHTVLDLSEVYAGQLAEARRGVALLDGSAVRVQDELAAPADTAAEVRWAMMTRADVEVTGDRTATLRRDGRTLQFHVQAPDGVQVETYATPSPADYEPSNPDAQLVGFTTTLEAGAETRLVVTLTPGSEEHSLPDVMPLTDW